jgi:hypothetical protein
LRAASPLLFDVVVPVGLYYLLSAAGVADTPTLIVSGLVPFARSVYGVFRAGKADYLAVMMAALFVLSLILVAVTGSPKFLLVRPYVIFYRWVSGADLGFRCLIGPGGDLRSWLRWLRCVEAERDRLAEQLEYAALFRGRC